MAIPSGKYRHYKGNVYNVLCIAKHSETLEDMVIYRDASDEQKIWARPLSMWDEIVCVNGENIKRFEKID